MHTSIIKLKWLIMTGIVAHTYPEWWLKLTGQAAHLSTDYSFGTFLNLYLLFQWVLLLLLCVSETTTILFLSIYCLISECMVFIHPFRKIAYLIFPWYCTPAIKIIFIMMLYFLLYLQIKRKDFV